jgi:hypothetical protein
LICLPSAADAQVLERPVRASERTESNVWRRLTFGVTTLGSWDDNVTADQVVVDPSFPSQSGYTGFADTSLRFEQGKGSQSFSASGHGYVNAFRNVGLTPHYGSDAQAQFVGSLGRRHRIEARQDFRDEPFYTIGGFSGLRQAVEVGPSPDSNPLNGVEKRRSWAAMSRIGLASQWSPRNGLGVAYGYAARDFRDHVGDTRAHNVSLSYNRNVGRRSMLKFNYEYTDAEFREPAGPIPSETHLADAGVNLERRFSPTRRIVVFFGGGAVQFRSVDRLTRESYEVLGPSGFGTIRLDWARSWSVSVDYRRSVGTLEGMSAQAFTTDAAMAQLGGFVSRRVEATFAVGYSEGKYDRQSASFGTYTGTSQMRFVLTRDWSALISHSYNQYSLRNVDLLFASLPQRFDRNAVRVGLTLNFPVINPREPKRPQPTERTDASR